MADPNVTVGGFKERVSPALGVFENEDGDPVAVAPDSPLPVLSHGSGYSDHSGTITAAATSQVLVAADTSRCYFLFQNLSDADMWLDFGVDAVAGQPSIKIAANTGYFEPFVVPTNAVNVLCASDGKDFACKTA